MKALSLTRPWPALIIHRGKRIENRSWNTRYRGLVLLHAAKSWNREAFGCAAVAELDSGRDVRDVDVWDLSRNRVDHPTGIVALAELVNVCSETVNTFRQAPVGECWCGCGPWAVPGAHHWRLDSVQPLPNPVPCNGALGLWTPPADVLAAVADLLVGVR